MSTETGSDNAADVWVIDELLECYVSWREECYVVHVAYQAWVDSTREEAWRAHARYVAALDREEQAARTYANRVKVLQRSSDDDMASQSSRLSAQPVTR